MVYSWMSIGQVRGATPRSDSAARVLRVAARHERGGFFLEHRHERDAVPTRAERVHDAVDAVAGQPEHDSRAPVDQPSTNTSATVLIMTIL